MRPMITKVSMGTVPDTHRDSMHQPLSSYAHSVLFNWPTYLELIRVRRVSKGQPLGIAATSFLAGWTSLQQQHVTRCETVCRCSLSSGILL